MNSDKDKTEEIEELMPVNAILILEVIGKPKEHLVDALNEMAKRIGEEKGVKIVEKKINEPIELEKHKGFFSTFAEIEVRVESIRNIAALMFKYMPAHIDILEPENLQLSNNLLSEVLNELTRRLHGYDEVARVIQVEKYILEKKLKSILEEQKTKAEASASAKEKENKKTEDKKE